MRKTSLHHWQITELLIPASVFFILVWYTYGILFVDPEPGFAFNVANGSIVEIYSPSEQIPTLQKDDVLIKIGNVTWESYKSDARVLFFEGAQPGDIVPITVNRNGAEITIPWEFRGFDQAVFNGRFLNVWWLAFIFWFFATAAQLLIRPKDGRRRLFLAANYLTAIWISFGALSHSHLWGSSILLHASTWLLLPVYLHLHWVFPRPLKELPKTFWILVYLIGSLFAAAEIVQVIPRSAYVLAFLAALIGSIALQFIRYLRQADQRPTVILLFVSTIIAFVPSVVFGILVAVDAVPSLGPIALFALPFMSLAYFYVIYRRQSGGLEVRLNRLISLYAFLIFLGTGLLVVVVPITTLVDISFETAIVIGGLVVLASTYMAITSFPVFQAFVERRFLGIKLPYQNLQETYSNRIAASTSTNDLLQQLADEVFPSLFIRQFAFMQVFNGRLKTLLSRNINPGQLPHENDMNILVSQAGMYRPYLSPDSGWARLILPLKAGDSFIGFWLLGQRDPDDLYPQSEIPILQSIANQTATALSNILHAEQVRKLFHLDIERYEQERLSLALDLHDSILNQLAAFRNNLGETALSQKLQDSYEEITRRLREIVSNLRPPMLMYGLKPAIIELADNLMERSGDKVKIKADLEASEERIPQHMEQHLFRIVQEACENSLRHSDARTVSIYGTLTSGKVDLNIHDDGKGFDADSKLELDNLLANHHFGLSGMIERAFLIDAKIKIHSGPNTGTRVHLTWSNDAETA